MLSKAENEYLCRVGPGTPMGCSPSAWRTPAPCPGRTEGSAILCNPPYARATVLCRNET
jgi:hypothetical protein